jgi:hypothetical protein
MGQINLATSSLFLFSMATMSALDLAWRFGDLAGSDLARFFLLGA